MPGEDLLLAPLNFDKTGGVELLPNSHDAAVAWHMLLQLLLTHRRPTVGPEKSDPKHAALALNDKSSNQQIS